MPRRLCLDGGMGNAIAATKILLLAIIKTSPSEEAVLRLFCVLRPAPGWVIAIVNSGGCVGLGQTASGKPWVEV